MCGDGQTIPMFAVTEHAVERGWSGAQQHYKLGAGGDFLGEKVQDFLYHLLNLRGEFGRLILTLATYNGKTGNSAATGHKEVAFENLHEQLELCLKCLSPMARPFQPNSPFSAILRFPGEQSDALYPGLVVHDERVTGSITIGPTRLPLWSRIAAIVEDGWSEDDELHGWTLAKMKDFLTSILNARGEFARLLLVLGNIEHQSHQNDALWWADHKSSDCAAKQLQVCIDGMHFMEEKL